MRSDVQTFYPNTLTQADDINNINSAQSLESETTSKI